MNKGMITMDDELYLKKNLGTIDRIVRFVIGTVLIAWSAISLVNSWWIAGLSAIGGSQIIQGITGY